MVVPPVLVAVAHHGRLRHHRHHWLRCELDRRTGRDSVDDLRCGALGSQVLSACSRVRNERACVPRPCLRSRRLLAHAPCRCNEWPGGPSAYSSRSTSSPRRYVAVTSPLRRRYVTVTRAEAPRRLAVTSPLRRRYVAVTSPLLEQKRLVASPLRRRYVSVTSPLLEQKRLVASPLRRRDLTTHRWASAYSTRSSPTRRSRRGPSCTRTRRACAERSRRCQCGLRRGCITCRTTRWSMRRSG